MTRNLSGFPEPWPHQLIGRAADLEKIYTQLRSTATKLLCIDGPSGVGKTAVADWIADTALITLGQRYQRTAVQSCWQESWGNVVARLATEIIGPEVAKAASVDTLELAILNVVKHSDVLLLLDNLETSHMDAFKQFSRRWAEATHRSTLVVTSIDQVDLTAPGIFRYHLAGLTGLFPLELFGAELRERFGDNVLLERARTLRGIPLDILYVRWLDPLSVDELDRTVAGISIGTLDRTLSLENALLEISRSPTHFMALGITRQLEFDEGLLAFFWDRMNGGTVQSYAEHRASLIEHRLLVPVPEMDGSRFRISEQVHKYLARALIRRIGGERRLPIVHYLASEYFRRALEAGRLPALDALGAFVYHSLTSGEYLRAYRYLFERDATAHGPFDANATDLHALRQTFLEFESTTGLRLRDVLRLFSGSNVQAALAPRERVRVLLELAHVASDLGEFDECVRLTREAASSIDAQVVDAQDSAEMWRRIWYYQGVSFSNTGESAEAVRSYFRIVESSSDGDVLGALCLGYLAHALLYIDMTAAASYGAESVRLAREIGDETLLAKSLASHAEVLIFAQEHARADQYFGEAAALCLQDGRSTGQREAARIMKNWGVLALARRDLELAEQRLLDGLARSMSLGDHRRVASGQQYLAIVRHHQGDSREAVGWMEASVRGAQVTGNGRYLVPALLTLARWKSPTYDGTLEGLLDVEFEPSVASYARGVAEQHRLGVFARFWVDHYWPLLCQW